MNGTVTVIELYSTVQSLSIELVLEALATLAQTLRLRLERSTGRVS
jgi:hypothetical protein